MTCKSCNAEMTWDNDRCEWQCACGATTYLVICDEDGVIEGTANRIVRRLEKMFIADFPGLFDETNRSLLFAVVAGEIEETYGDSDDGEDFLEDDDQ